MTTSSENTRTRETAGSLLAVFGLDLRSLAVFRMAIGLVILADLAWRSQTLREMYSAQGFFTRQLSFDYHQHIYGDAWTSVLWSIHWLSDKFEFQATLFIIAACFAFLLTIGKWTRVATIVCWVLVASLHVRNPLVTTSGDGLLKAMLFWSIFLPLGAVWSFDCQRRLRRDLDTPNVKKPIVSIATAALIIQIVCMYFFTGLAKWNEGWWTGDAMYHALGLDIYATEFGKSLLGYPVLLKLTSIATVFAEVILIWLLFVPRWNGWLRLMLLAIFWSFHIGILLSMSIGLFSWISMSTWLALLPGFVWGRAGSGELSATDRHSYRLNLLEKAICAFMLLMTIMWNVNNIESEVLEPFRSRWMTRIGLMARVDQRFQMFGQPPKSTPWFVYEAVLDDGSLVDLWTGKAPSNEPPKSMLEWMPNFHWRKLHRNLVARYNEPVRTWIAEYMVNKWNRDHDKKVKQLRMVYFSEATGPNRKNLNRHTRIWAVVKSDQNAGSLFDKVSDDNKQDPLNLGF